MPEASPDICTFRSAAYKTYDTIYSPSGTRRGEVGRTKSPEERQLTTNKSIGSAGSCTEQYAIVRVPSNITVLTLSYVVKPMDDMQIQHIYDNAQKPIH